MWHRTIVIAALLTAVTGCGKASPVPTNPSPTPTPGSTVSIVAGATTKTSTAYSPNPITISRGGAVMWVNNDTTTHTSTANDNSWNSGNIAPGGSFSHTFASAGTFSYHCMIHPGMVGTVSVQ